MSGTKEPDNSLPTAHSRGKQCPLQGGHECFFEAWIEDADVEEDGGQDRRIGQYRRRHAETGKTFGNSFFGSRIASFNASWAVNSGKIKPPGMCPSARALIIVFVKHCNAK
jgi:hypothetical protein